MREINRLLRENTEIGNERMGIYFNRLVRKDF